jgi:YidC/Oxa1 family membrane protein insertase
MGIWNTFFYEPIYNLVFYIMEILPGYEYGLAIIITTALIKTLIAIPTQKGLKNQKQLQVIQPEIATLKKKYAKNPQVQAQKIMELYKKHKVNPFGSCLPLLIQFPILIALFFVFKNGIGAENSEILYASLFPNGFDFTQIKTTILGGISIIEITSLSKYILPVLIGGMQFGQMYRSQAHKAKQPTKEIAKKTDGMPDPQEMQKMMMYFMPVLIAFFAASYPAAVSLYWATSTLYTIIQQEIVIRFSK